MAKLTNDIAGNVLVLLLDIFNNTCSDGSIMAYELASTSGRMFVSFCVHQNIK